MLEIIGSISLPTLAAAIIIQAIWGAALKPVILAGWDKVRGAFGRKAAS